MRTVRHIGAQDTYADLDRPYPEKSSGCMSVGILHTTKPYIMWTGSRLGDHMAACLLSFRAQDQHADVVCLHACGSSGCMAAITLRTTNLCRCGSLTCLRNTNARTPSVQLKWTKAVRTQQPTHKSVSTHHPAIGSGNLADTSAGGPATAQATAHVLQSW